MSSGIYPGPLETFRGHFHVPQHSQIVPRDNSRVARDRSHDPQDLPSQGSTQSLKVLPGLSKPTETIDAQSNLISWPAISAYNSCYHHHSSYSSIYSIYYSSSSSYSQFHSLFLFIYLFIYISTHIFHSKWIRFSFSAPKRPMSVYSPF